MTNWCLQAGLAKPQYTKCESTTNEGNTCINPQVKYGTSPIGLPRKHGSNNYEKWCEQLGGTYQNHTIGTRRGLSLFGCTSHDDRENWHWCDWQNGHWFNASLDHNLGPHTDAITSITCTSENLVNQGM